MGLRPAGMVARPGMESFRARIPASWLTFTTTGSPAPTTDSPWMGVPILVVDLIKFAVIPAIVTVGALTGFDA